jgi:hypothetical protein
MRSPSQNFLRFSQWLSVGGTVLDDAVSVRAEVLGLHPKTSGPFWPQICTYFICMYDKDQNEMIFFYFQL